MTRRRSLISLTLGGATAVVVVGALVFAGSPQRTGSSPRPAAASAAPATPDPPATLPVMWQMPSFSFRDQHGALTAPEDLRGHVWIANFFFSRCTTVCPLITAKMALLQRRLRSPGLRFVSFSVDPAHDTPEALKEYAARWRAGETRWTLLSTTPAALQGLAAAMYTKIKPGENDINHTRLFFLVDAQGDVRGIYESERDDAVDRLVRDAQALEGVSPSGLSPPAETMTGSELYAALQCGACHARRELAPPIEGLEGRRVRLEGGAEITADASYVREAIVAPDARRTAGYAARMPSYERELTPGQLDALVAYVVSVPVSRPGRTRR